MEKAKRIKTEKSDTLSGLAPEAKGRSARTGPDAAPGKAPERHNPAPAIESGTWTPAKGGRREDDKVDNADRIPTAKDVRDAKERRDSDDKGGPDA